MPPGLEKTLSSKAAKPRTGWFILLVNMNGIYEVNLGWRSYDGSLAFYSTAPRSSSVKPPWGPIVSANFHTIVNGRKEEGLYFKFMNELGDSKNFKGDLLNLMLAGVNDFTQACMELVMEKKSKLFSLYLSLLTQVRDFKNHRPDVHSEDGLPADIEAAQDVKVVLEKNGGSYEEFVKFSDLARANAYLVVKEHEEVLKCLPGFSPSNSKKRKNPDNNSPTLPPEPKMSKAEQLARTTKAELGDADGVEKAFTSSYLGKADVHLDNI